MLGWRILSTGEYCLDLPQISDEEKNLILHTEERIKEFSRKTCTDIKTAIEQALLDSANASGFYLNKNQIKYLNQIAYLHIYGFGFLELLINDNEIEGISVIGPDKPVYVYIRKTGWKMVNACFENEQAITDIINKMAHKLGRHITLQNPRLDAILPNGSRLHASLPPLSIGEITIRKFREQPFSPKELGGIITFEMMAFLSMIMQSDFSVILAGNTASGKTTTLNALFSFVPLNERVVITEETPEINIPHEHQLRMVANKAMDISLKDLVYDSLRMRPDRMVIGEVRNKDEVEALFDVLLAGQARGSYATFHAQSAHETLSRLTALGVKETDLDCIDCIIVQRRMLEYDIVKRTSQEVRKVTEIAEVKNNKINLIYKNGKILGSSLEEKISESFGLDKKGFDGELRKRAEMIANAPGKYSDFVTTIQNMLFGGSA